MAKWQNWSGRLSSKPDQLSFIYSEDQAAALAKASTQAVKSLRSVGAGHSHKELVVDGDIIADLQALTGVLSVDTDEGTAWVGGGSKIHTLGPALHRHGLALANQGDIDQQSISGATATGTHGTGATLQNLSSRVTGARIALATGRLSNVRQSKTANCGWLAACIWARLDSSPPCSCSACRLIGCKSAAGRFRWVIC